MYAGSGRHLAASYQFVSVGAMEEMSSGNVLESLRGTVTFAPAQLLDKMDRLVFHNPLQRFKSVVARQSANSDDLPVSIAKSVEQQ